MNAASRNIKILYLITEKVEVEALVINNEKVCTTAVPFIICPPSKPIFQETQEKLNTTVLQKYLKPNSCSVT